MKARPEGGSLRLTLVIHGLGAGGAERVLCLLASHWCRRHAVTVLTLTGEESPAFFSLAPGIELRRLGVAGWSRNTWQAFKANLHRIRILRAELRESRPDIVISFMDTTNVLTLLAAFGQQGAVVVCEHNNPGMHRQAWVWRMMRRLVYPLAQRIVVLTEDARGFFTGKAAQRVEVIPNPVILPGAEEESSGVRLRKPAVVAMGRLSPQKGFDMLLKAFAGAVRQNPAWSLTILGEGEERDRLTRQASSLGIAGNVSLPGVVPAPGSVLRQADIFALSSRYEGFPMALCEAMACGLPVVCFDCPSGPRDIVRPGIDGILVPAGDVAGLEQALLSLMADGRKRQEAGVRAAEVVERFGSDRVLPRWDSLLAALAGKKPCGMR